MFTAQKCDQRFNFTITGWALANNRFVGSITSHSRTRDVNVAIKKLTDGRERITVSVGTSGNKVTFTTAK